jgi:NAD(P)-dependent dehydrogenase (short-subunit alcohol dehydrogenase family)
MDIQGAGVVVTGGGNGIGRVIAGRFAAEGARVVVNDIDVAAAEAVAEQIGGHAIGGDAASEVGVDKLIAAAKDHLGAIDVYCANAGVAVGQGLQAPEAEWQFAWDVNVMAHVRAARMLVPAWLTRGSGRFVVTASAAGLLTMLGSATYSVTKHAAVAHAEWLSATYRHRGIDVHCICPQGVRTAMLDKSGDAGSALLLPTAIEPEAVAEALFAGMAEGRFLILPHPEVHTYFQHRSGDTDRWLGGMNKLQRQLEQGTASRRS